MAALAEVLLKESTTVGEEWSSSLSLRGVSMPLTLRFATPISDEALFVFSRANRPYQIERNAHGELEVMSPGLLRGGQREALAAATLFLWAEQHGGIAPSSETGYKLRDSAIRCPDASWTSTERAGESLHEQQDQYAPFCPEFLIEIRSSRDSRKALESKMAMWIDAGALLAWMIDPFTAEVVIYRPGLPPERLDRPDWVEADSVVTGFRLETARMWEK